MGAKVSHPEKVVKEVIRIQRNFLWGGVGGGRKICWVSWKKVCQPRSKGGLGVRDVRLVNLSLMAKWKWRLLQEDFPLWKVVLSEKYGDFITGAPPVDGYRWPRFSSIWWKDLLKIEGGVGGIGSLIGWCGGFLMGEVLVFGKRGGLGNNHWLLLFLGFLISHLIRTPR